jgi:hypothetical protein
MWVLGPTAEILFFVWPKKSIQKKGHLQCDLQRYAVLLRLQAQCKPFMVCPFACRLTPCAPRFQQGLAEGRSIALCQRAALFAMLSCIASKVRGLPSMANPLRASASPLPRPFGRFLLKAAVLSAAAGGGRKKKHAQREHVSKSDKAELAPSRDSARRDWPSPVLTGVGAHGYAL